MSSIHGSPFSENPDLSENIIANGMKYGKRKKEKQTVFSDGLLVHARYLADIRRYILYDINRKRKRISGLLIIGAFKPLSEIRQSFGLSYLIDGLCGMTCRGLALFRANKV